MDLFNLKAHEMLKHLKNKDFKVSELVSSHIERTKSADKKINAFISLDFENAIKLAEELDIKQAKNEMYGALFGLPIGLKDNISQKDIKLSCASHILGEYKALFDAHLSKLCKKNNAVILGKLNMDEFAMGGSNETSYYGAVKNPLDETLVPGGSSGGSAAAVAAKEVALSVGTDTGGSVRQPASYCSIVGIKPTYGTVSRNGIVSLSNTLDQAAPFGRDVKDASLILSAISGYDSSDATSLDNPIHYIDYDRQKAYDYLKGIKIGIPKEILNDSMDEECRNSYIKSIDLIKNAGAKFEEIELKSLKYAVAVYYIIMNSEAGSNLSRFDGIRYGIRAKDYENIEELYIKTRSEGFGSEVKRRILLGTYILSSKGQNKLFENALKARTLIIKDFKESFSKVDFIMTPTSPMMPFKIGSNVKDPIKMYNADKYTVPVNICGNCAVSVPSKSGNELSAGVQFIGDKFKDNDLLKLAYAFEGLVE